MAGSRERRWHPTLYYRRTTTTRWDGIGPEGDHGYVWPKCDGRVESSVEYIEEGIMSMSDGFVIVMVMVMVGENPGKLIMAQSW